MPIAPGTKLGNYEIVAPIGAGGMGEVYRASDTRLDRTVAIKVLPRHLSENAELRQRFEQEARAVASLNHPNICTLHDIGRENGVDFIVMEYIEGETLFDRLLKGALPLDEALHTACAVGDALDKAHRKGIIHRDVKPGNVMLTKSGPKLLDFGLAKVQSKSVREPDLSAVTEQKPLTEKGAILGTLQYMAPEQLERRRYGFADRHLRLRRTPVRNRYRAESVRRQEPGESHQRDHVVGAAADLGAATGDAEERRSHRPRMSRERSGRSVAIRA